MYGEEVLVSEGVGRQDLERIITKKYWSDCVVKEKKCTDLICVGVEVRLCIGIVFSD